MKMLDSSRKYLYKPANLTKLWRINITFGVQPASFFQARVICTSTGFEQTPEYNIPNKLFFATT